ncbi:MAG: hypothetical protein RIC35_14735 [Marinoscillum sp.]
MKKLVLTITLFTGIFGCGTCPEYDGFYFDINGLVIFNMEKRSPNARFGVDEGTNLEFKNHSFTISYTANYYSLNEINNIGLISSALATSCSYSGEGGSQEYLDTLVVTTNFDIDEQHLKGESINDIILYNGKVLNSFLATDSIEIPHQTFSLELTQKPELDNSLSINILVKLLNGEEYTATSERVFIK